MGRGESQSRQSYQPCFFELVPRVSLHSIPWREGRSLSLARWKGQEKEILWERVKKRGETLGARLFHYSQNMS